MCFYTPPVFFVLAHIVDLDNAGLATRQYMSAGVAYRRPILYYIIHRVVSSQIYEQQCR